MAGLLRLTPGEVFASRFEIRAALAEGGMGTVYAVTDRADGSSRALKVLLPELVVEERSRIRFNQEARVGAQIDSPYVPRVFGSGIDERGIPWIAMELLEGRDLRQHIRERGALGLEEARPILDQVGSALAAAHRRGLVHRDLKPENVFLHDQGGTTVVKLLDFGVAKVIDLHRTSATGTGAIGSPMWMAPEQTSAGGRIAPSTDVWAYALLTFFVLTGRFYWKAAQDDSGVGGLLRELHLDPVDPPSTRAALLAPHVRLPAGLDAWFLRAMQRPSTERFRDAGEALEALRPLLRPADRSPQAFASTADAPSERDAARTVPMKQPPMPLVDDRAGELAADLADDLGGPTSPDGWEREPLVTLRDTPIGPDLPITSESIAVPLDAAEGDPTGRVAHERVTSPRAPLEPARGAAPTDKPADSPAASRLRRAFGMSPALFVVLLVVVGALAAALTAVIVLVVLTVT